jgi:hypothetical protein
MGLAVRALAVIALCAGISRAQPGLSTTEAAQGVTLPPVPAETPAPSVGSTSQILRDGNTAALAGDWPRVSQRIAPLLHRQLALADLAEAYRLAGLAAFFEQRTEVAESRFLGYLRIDLDGRLDPALYPPEVVAFFNDVASRHAAELQALRSAPKRSWLLTLLPPIGQLQNGEPIKAYVLGGALGALLITNLTTYYYLRAWCEHTDGTAGGGLSCYDGGPTQPDRNHAAARLRPWNIASGIGFLVVYAYGVYDGVRGYRQRSREQAIQPFVAASAGNHVLGVAGSF